MVAFSIVAMTTKARSLPLPPQIELPRPGRVKQGTKFPYNDEYIYDSRTTQHLQHSKTRTPSPTRVLSVGLARFPKVRKRRSFVKRGRLHRFWLDLQLPSLLHCSSSTIGEKGEGEQGQGSRRKWQ